MLNNFVEKAGVKKITTAQSNSTVGGRRRRRRATTTSTDGGGVVAVAIDGDITGNRPPTVQKDWKAVG